MPSYAVLGATGQTGRSLVKVLLQSDGKNDVNVYVRSRSRWETLRPAVPGVENVQVFEGSLFDIPLMARCVSGVSAIFACVATNDNTPGVRIAQDTAQVIVAALCHLRASAQQNDSAVVNKQPPRIIMLSSSTINPHLCRHQPALLHGLLARAWSHVYADLALAEKYLRLHRSWLSATFIQPGALVPDEQRGHAISLEREKSFLSYLDLAAGMVEVAESDGKYDWMGVAVVPTGDDTKVEWRVPIYMAKGLLWHFLPWLYWLTAYFFWYACWMCGLINFGRVLTESYQRPPSLLNRVHIGAAQERPAEPWRVRSVSVEQCGCKVRVHMMH